MRRRKPKLTYEQLYDQALTLLNTHTTTSGEIVNIVNYFLNVSKRDSRDVDDILKLVASHPSSTEDTLFVLSRHGSLAVKKRVPLNKNVTTDILKYLMRIKDRSLDMAILKSPNVTMGICHVYEGSVDEELARFATSRFSDLIREKGFI